ncbi:MAG: hypothetical protein Q7K16_00335 [Candidatus Azambacteria bacterium]|nr:hypothetical protein [Candidatus Azambacteria bacterium]
MQDVTKDTCCYERYQELGGIINEKDYKSALTRAKDITAIDTELTEQLKSIARLAGIELHNTKNVLDQRTILYGVLRTDTKPKVVKYHHSQMSDQRLFAEVLRMLGDVDSLSRLINTHPHISFD